MTNADHTEVDIPVWARASSFPLKPQAKDTQPYGYVDSKGHYHQVATAKLLIQAIEKAQRAIDLVWTPDSDRLAVPEQIELAHAPLRRRAKKTAELDLSNGLRITVLSGFVFLWVAYSAWSRGGAELSAIYRSQLVGLVSLFMLIFGLIPLYRGWKSKRNLDKTEPESLYTEVSEAQFDIWLARQRVPITYTVIGCLLLCALVQLYLEKGGFSFMESILKAGLLKQQALAHPELSDGMANWRMYTAPMLHGNAIHFLMNASGILYLGRRSELLAGWSHLLIVLLSGMLAGALASYHFLPAHISVGASGGLTSLLGFLLVFEFLHRRLVPRPARRRLLAGLLLMVITGFLGVSFIDNAAHAGGLLAGMFYAAVVFPHSSSAFRPKFITKDKVAGSIASIILILLVVLAIMKMLS